jgi:signal transduction histidine kinase
VEETKNESTPPLTEEARLRELLAAMEASNRGDFSRRLPVHGTHPLLDRLAEAFNTSASLNAALTQELSRVERAVGREGRLDERVSLGAVSGDWAAGVQALNALIESFAAQVRDLDRVARAVARGDLSQKVTVDVGGEVLELKNTVNTMVDHLSAFAAEVTRVSKELSTDGKPSRPTNLQNVAGVWKDLSDNVTVTEQLALASRYKSEFLANMSHELRTPLNSLLILARVLSENKEQRLSPKEVEYARTIHSSGADLLELINEILDLSKVEAGKMKVEPCDVPLDDVKEFVERHFRHVAEQRELGFFVSLGVGLPASVHTDPQRLHQVLKNLLSNAFKFTHSGRVELRVTPVDGRLMRFDSEALRRAERVIAFSVVDSGIGIPLDKQRLIFEAFQQAEGSTSRKYGGTGLGLSISLTMTRLLGGELRVDSQPGQGSTFTLYLPERSPSPGAGTSAGGGAAPETGGRFSGPQSGGAPSQEPLAAPPAPAEPDARLAGRKVLIVDDDIRNIFALTSALEAHRVKVVFAESGEQGLETLRAHPDVDAVLMDMMMPGMDGYEAMRGLRKDPRFVLLPVIAITAQVLKDDRQKCLAAGASDYLPKPVDTDRLLELLRRWCR